MVIERHPPEVNEVNFVDLVDRVLDKGIVIDSWMRPFVLGLDLWMTIESQVTVASIETYLRYAELWKTPRTPRAPRSHV
jgi:hypothetical protein